MSAVRSEAAMDAVERRKLHVHVADMRKEVQRLQKLVELTRPAQLPSLQPSSSDPLKPKKALPLFGAMKGGTKYKLKTGTIGKLPPKRANLPAELFNMKGGGVEEEEDDEEEEERAVKPQEKMDSSKDGDGGSPAPAEPQAGSPARAVEDEQPASSLTSDEHRDEPRAEEKRRPSISPKMAPSSSPAPGEGGETAVQPSPKRSGRKKALGPSRPPVTGPYPEDDPDYCVWLPPTGQSGDGRTHLNEKFGY